MDDADGAGPTVHRHDDLDLTPRTASELADGGRGGFRVRNWLIGGAVAAVLGFLLFQALTSARVYFYNVDEAVERRDELADRTFRMQGTVVSEVAEQETGALVFTVAFDDASAQVRHVGPEPTDLFELGIPVVVEGRWQGDEFVSDQILVKHSEEYVEDNPDRIDGQQ